MNWRRGILLAAIHLVVAGSLLTWEESESWRYLKSKQPEPSPARLELAAFQEEGETITFNPCADEGFIDGEMPPQERVSGMANLPIALLTGWHEPCKSPRLLDSMVESLLSSIDRTRFHRTRSSEILILIVLCALVAAEWLFVGGFPLMQSRFWWVEPGALITACTLAGAALATIPHVAYLSVVPATMAGCAWLWWFGLLVWKALQFGWRVAAGWRVPRSS
jgi:hypothetical protein